MDDTALGTLTRDGDRWTLTFTRKLAHSREKVWRAVTEPEHLAVWYPQEIVGERRAGAPLRFVSSVGEGFDGQMLVFDPPEVVEFTWGADRLRIELQADGAGTLLTLTDTFDDLGKAARDGKAGTSAWTAWSAISTGRRRCRGASAGARCTPAT